MEPTLNDITSIRGNADIAGGTAGSGAGLDSPAPVQFDQGLQFLNEASQARAGYNKYLADAYAQNLKDSLANLRSIDFSKAMASDLPALRQKYADLAKNISDNFDAVRNPGSNPEVAGQLAQQEADLRGAIEQSTNHNAINTYNKNFVAANPTFNTKENQDKIAGFEQAPMDQRKDFLLSTPNNFDLQKVAQLAAPYALKTIQKESLSHDGNWINSYEGQQFSKEAYHNAALAIKNNSIINGQSLNDAWNKDYNLLPDEYKQGMNSDQAFLAGIDALAPQTALKTSFTANPYGLNKQREGFDMTMENKREAFQANQSALDRAERDKFQKNGQVDPNTAAESKMRNMAIIESTGEIPANIAQPLFGDNALVTKSFTIPKDPDNKDAGKTTTTAKVPKTSYTGGGIDPNGNIHLYFRDNLTGKALPAKVLSHNDFYNAMDGLYGQNFAPRIGGASTEFSQKNFKKPIPTAQDLLNHYQLPAITPDRTIQAQGAPAQNNSIPTGASGVGLTDDAYQNLLRKNGLIK